MPMRESSEQKREILRAFMKDRSLTVNGWAEKSGVKEGALRSFLKGGTASMKIETYQKLADSEKVPISTLLGESNHLPGINPHVKVDYVMAKRTAKTGVWLEYPEWPEESWYPIMAAQYEAYKPDSRFGILIDDDSMNKEYLPGSVLDCVDIDFIKYEPVTGDHVAVERLYNDTKETTIKEIEITNGRVFLWPRSTNPNHTSPLIINHIGAPSNDENISTKVIGLVLGSYKARPAR